MSSVVPSLRSWSLLMLMLVGWCLRAQDALTVEPATLEPLTLEQSQAIQALYAASVQQEPGEVEAIPGLGSAFYNGKDVEIIVSGFSNPTNDTVQLARLYGPGAAIYTPIAPQTRVAADTVFEIGSVTKTFTSAALLLHRDQGQISLDARLDDWLPLVHRLPGANCPDGGTCPDVRQLLGMRSGIPDLDDNFCDMPALCDTKDQPASVTRLVADGNMFSQVWYTFDYLGTVKPSFPPGSSYAYSNTNYFLVGQMLLQLENYFNLSESYGRVSGRAGIKHVWLGSYQPIPEGLRAMGWTSKGHARENSKSFVTSYWAGGGILAEPGDVAKWLYALLHPGMVLSADSLEEMTRFAPYQPAGPIDPDVPEFVCVGYGLGMADYRIGPEGEAVQVLGHLGLTGGFVSFAGYLADKDLSFMMVVNRREPTDFLRLVCKVVEILSE